ncbi:MAG: hypothetical protein SNJ74_11550 [Fimbriimonadaceae bacterium]
MAKAVPAEAVDLRLWLEKAISEPQSEYGAFIYDDLPFISDPPASWVKIVEDVTYRQLLTMDVDMLFACVTFLVKSDSSCIVKLSSLRYLLERVPSVKAILLALDVWQQVEAPNRESLSKCIISAYDRMKPFHKWWIRLDGRFRSIANSGEYR